MDLCLGTVQLGMDYGIRGNKQGSLESSLRVLETAVCAHGISALDTAEEYGSAMQVIGEFFRRNLSYAQTVQVISKTKKASEDDPYPPMRRQAASSIETMRIPALGGLLLHNEDDLYRPEATDALLRLKEEGLVAHTGVSIYSPSAALYASTHPAIDYIQIPYNALDRRLEGTEFFENAKRNGKTIFARSIFLQGLLLMENPPVEGSAAHVRAFQELARKHGISPAEACIQYVMGNTAIDYIVLGVDFSEEIEENILAMRRPRLAALQEEIKGSIICKDETVLVPSLWRKDAENG